MPDAPSVIFETVDFAAINKPAGWLVHCATGQNDNVLTDWLVRYYPALKRVGEKPLERPGIVHRLDKDTSGVLLVAKTQAAFEILKNLFQSHQIKKSYLALVWGDLKPKKGTINQPISLSQGVKRTTFKGKQTKEAVTDYEVINCWEIDNLKFSLVRLKPKTGRTHQLRVHLNSLHHPVVGDKMYSRRLDPWRLSRHFLHAESVEFSWPNNGYFKIEADLTEDLQKVIDSLEKQR